MITPVPFVNVTPSGTGWREVALASHISAAATGVILWFCNTNWNSEYDFKASVGWRRNGSTDNRTTAISSLSHVWAFVGVDANKKVEVYRVSGVVVGLIGYFEGEATFFTNGIEYTSSSNAWHDVSIAAATGTSTAIAALWELTAAGAQFMGVRKKGSTDDIRRNVGHSGAICGVDNDEVCQIFRGHSNARSFLLGYLTAGAVLLTNAIDVTPPTTDFTVITLPEGAAGVGMGFFSVITQSNSDWFRFRDVGSSPPTGAYTVFRLTYPAWGCNVDRQLEVQRTTTGVTVWLIGYAVATSTQHALTITGNTVLVSNLRKATIRTFVKAASLLGYTPKQVSKPLPTKSVSVISSSVRQTEKEWLKRISIGPTIGKGVGTLVSKTVLLSGNVFAHIVVGITVLVTAGLSVGGSIQKVIARTINRLAIIRGQTEREVSKAVAAPVGLTGSIAWMRVFVLTLLSGITAAGNVTKTVIRFFNIIVSGVLGLGATVGKSISLSSGTRVATVGLAVRRVGKVTTGRISLSAVLEFLRAILIAARVSVGGMLTKIVTKTLAVYVKLRGLCGRGFRLLLVGNMTAVGNLLTLVIRSSRSRVLGFVHSAVILGRVIHSRTIRGRKESK